MKKIITHFLIASFFILMSCNVEPQKITYGKDSCHYCSMSIVDQLHAAQLVNTKGKAFKYDAVECLINDLEAKKADQIGLLLVSDYNNPGILIDAKQAHYIISKNIPSPMGAYLSSVLTKEIALDLKKNKGGEIYTWDEITNHFKNK